MATNTKTGQAAQSAAAKRASAPFLSDVKTLRAQARKQIDAGPVTAAYGADLERVITVLNVALATEIVCVQRYKAHHYGAKGLASEPAAAEFLQHSIEEQVHADRLADRIDQLGGTPELDPATFTAKSQTEYGSATALVEMIKEDLIAERVVIQAYAEAIAWLGNNDPTTRRLFEDILAEEEEHANDMLTLLERVG